MNDPRRPGGGTGPIAVVTATVATVALWYLLRPAGFSEDRYVAEVAGVLAVELLAVALVLALRLPLIERTFGGFERVYAWHRWVASVGVLLVIPHEVLIEGAALWTPDPASPDFALRTGFGNNLGIVAIAGLAFLGLVAFLPQTPIVRNAVRFTHARWLAVHRFIGLFVAAAVVHGLLVDPVIRASAPLWWIYFAIGAVGVGAYVVREVDNLRLSRRGSPSPDDTPGSAVADETTETSP